MKGEGGLGTAEQREEIWLGIEEIGWLEEPGHLGKPRQRGCLQGMLSRQTGVEHRENAYSGATQLL